MINEHWDWAYLTLDLNGKKFTVKILHYYDLGESKREWYRIMTQDFDPTKEACKQIFGYGFTLNQAIHRFGESINGHG